MWYIYISTNGGKSDREVNYMKIESKLFEAKDFKGFCGQCDLFLPNGKDRFCKQMKPNRQRVRVSEKTCAFGKRDGAPAVISIDEEKL